MYRKISLLFILAGASLTSAAILGGCVPTNPYQLVDKFEADPTDAKTNNNDFSRATTVALKDEAAAFDSALTLGDVDVYDLGGFRIGDQLTVEVSIPDRVLLNATVGIFDSVGRMFYLTGEWKDIASSPLTDANFPAFAPNFTYVVRQATPSLFLGIASLAEVVEGNADAFIGRTGGPYSISVKVRRWVEGDPLPSTSSQVVALQFDNAVVDYPPASYFGQISNMGPITFAGFNGLVLDPAWWRPFMIMQVTMEARRNNAPFWDGFLTFANAANAQLVGQTLAPELYGILRNQMRQAIIRATDNPGNFTSGQALWFASNGFQWLYVFNLYLDQGVTGATPTPGLGIWDSVLPGNYPTALDTRYSEGTAVTTAIKARMQQDYAGLNIDVRAMGTDAVPGDAPVSTIYFVSNSNGAGMFGLASSIDMMNIDHTDFAVIWAGEIGYSNSRSLATSSSDVLLDPSLTIAYTGSVGSHELGHILGLVHTQPDFADIMSYRNFQTALTSTFTNTPLWSEMFPIGTQDSFRTLLLTLGLATAP